MTLKRSILALLPLLFLLVGSVSVAQEGRPERPGAGHRMDRLVEKMGLSDLQRTSLEELMSSRRDLMRDHGPSMKAAAEALDSQVKSEIFDELAIRDAAAEVAALQADAAVQRAQMRQELAKILSPDQLEQFEEMQHLRGGHGRGPARHRR